jgi:hypothetical protein
MPGFAPAARAVALAIALTASARAALWVSPGGDDANPGTEDQPVRTLARARDLVRAINHDMADDITVFVAGEHHLERPLEFGPEDSGTNGFSIVYTAAPGERPALNGALRIAGWTLSDKARSLWSAPAPPGLAAPCDLYVNGMRAARTRSRLLAVFSQAPRAAAATAPEPRAQWRNPDDVVFAPAETEAVWAERTAPSPAFVENAFELLGRPGQWYLDRPARRVYYTPRPGENMASADVEAAVAPALVVGAGSAERPLTGLIFKGFRFEYTASAGSAPQDPASAARGAVGFAGASGIQLLEDQFLHLGGTGLELGPRVASGTVEGCLFGDIAWPAVRVAGASGVRIVESRFSYTALDRVHDGAIEVSQSDGVVVEHDQLDHFPTAAVLVRDGKKGSVHRASNWITPPMISFAGYAARGPASIPSEEIGISLDYRELEDERFWSMTAPMPPNAVSASAGDGSAYVTWIPNCRDGGFAVESYTVESSGGAKMTVEASEFERTGYVVMADLANGRPVSFTVSAANSAGAGPPSPASADVTPRQSRRLRTPSAPMQVAVTTGAAGASVQISPPASDGGSPILSYRVKVAEGGAPVVIEGLDVIHSDAAHPVTRTLHGIAPAAGSTVSVVAVNAAGIGKPAVVAIK